MKITVNKDLLVRQPMKAHLNAFAVPCAQNAAMQTAAMWCTPAWWISLTQATGSHVVQSRALAFAVGAVCVLAQACSISQPQQHA